jgi:hypothetical protein
MKLFRKNLTPEELGAIIYEKLRAHLASDDELSISSLLSKLPRREEDLPDQHQGAIMIGTMFGALLAIERSTSRWTAKRITDGMHREFFAHLREQGASPVQVKEWEQIVDDHYALYRPALEGYEEGGEAPWRLGRQFLWNIIGAEEYVATQIKEATLFLLQALDVAQSLMNKYGPTLILD